MDLRKVLLSSNSKDSINNIVKYIGTDQERFERLMELFLGDNIRTIQKASWTLSVCAEKNPVLIKNHLSKLVKLLDKSEDKTIKRNIVRLLQFVNIPTSLQGRVIDTCFKLLTSKKESIAVKVFSMTVIQKLVKNEPELQKELIIAIEDQLPFESAGFKSRGSKILKSYRSNKKS